MKIHSEKQTLAKQAASKIKTPRKDGPNLILLLIFSIIIIGTSMRANAQNGNLLEISKFASEICDSVPLNGSNTDVKAKGELEAKISEKLKALGKIGGSVSADVQHKEYEGIPQDQLVKALSNRQSCKIEIVKILLGKTTTSSNTHVGDEEFRQKYNALATPPMTEESVFMAAKMFNIEMVKRYIDLGFQPDTPDPKSDKNKITWETILYYAAIPPTIEGRNNDSYFCELVDHLKRKGFDLRDHRLIGDHHRDVLRLISPSNQKKKILCAYNKMGKDNEIIKELEIISKFYENIMLKSDMDTLDDAVPNCKDNIFVAAPDFAPPPSAALCRTRLQSRKLHAFHIKSGNIHCKQPFYFMQIKLFATIHGTKAHKARKYSLNAFHDQRRH